MALRLRSSEAIGRFLARRLFVTLLVIAVTSVIAFSLVHLSGDPAVAMAGEGASAADIESGRRIYGFDQPLYVQYYVWLSKIAAGDLGRSFYLRESVAKIIAESAPVTATLGFFSLVFALAVSLPLGILAAVYRNTIIDRMTLSIAIAGQVLPSFLFGLLLIYLFGVWLRWLPISGGTGLTRYILPAITLGYYAAPALMRLTRSGMIEALQSDHVRTARAYGLARWRVVLRHALRSAIIPVVSLTAVQLGLMLGGSVVVETVFSLRGLGQLAWQSIQRSDIEVIQAILLLIAVIYAILTLLADMLNAAIDPRVRVA